jgi:hypothetical protein
MDNEMLAEKFALKLAHYRAKLDRADALADDNYNRWDMLEHTILAIEYLAADCGVVIKNPLPQD